MIMSQRSLLQPSLASVVAPISARTFIADYWQQRHLATHGRRLDRILADLEGADLKRMVSACEEVIVLFRGTDQKRRSIHVGPREALELYEAGTTTLYFPLAMPTVSAWITALASDLGVTPARSQVSIFASRTGGGLESHFDTAENFTFQLKGHKRWRVSAGERVENPTMNSVAEAFATGEMSAYQFDPLPTMIPAEASTVDMRPGSMLYLPPGAWHETDAAEESLSLNLCFLGTNWLDHIALPAIRATLLRHAKWRQWPQGLFGAPAERARARTELASLLAGLPEDLAALTAECVLPPESPPRVPARGIFRRDPLVSLHVDRFAPSGKAWVRITRRRALAPLRRVEVEVGKRELPAYRWVAKREAPFRADDLRAATRLQGRALDTVLRVLLQEGAINSHC
jgi:Cupin superfamily protein